MSMSERAQAWGGQGRVEGVQAPCSLLTSYPTLGPYSEGSPQPAIPKRPMNVSCARQPPNLSPLLSPGPVLSPGGPCWNFVGELRPVAPALFGPRVTLAPE